MRQQVKKTLWIVEDHEQMCASLARLVASISSIDKIETYSDAESALAELNNRPAPDLVVMDISLPGMNGVDAVRSFKRIAPKSDIMMLTVHEDNDTIFQAICAGASGYLLKSTDNESLLNGIQELLDGGAPLNPMIARRVLNMVTQFNQPGFDYGLTEREQEILRLMVDGHNRSIIAEKLFLSPFTIGTHAKNIYSKLHVHSRGAAVAKALKERLI
jgi:DNA-binding NarL/FixJ family response regulator